VDDLPLTLNFTTTTTTTTTLTVLPTLGPLIPETLQPQMTIGPLRLGDLAISKEPVGDFVSGQTGTYQLTVTNVGNGPAAGPITVTDDLGPGLTFVSATGNGWTCSGSGQSVTCTYSGQLAAGQSLPPITVTVSVPDNVDAVSNCATVKVQGDSNPDNNRICVKTLITGEVPPICENPVETVFVAGVDDNFNTSNGAELSSPSVDLQAFLSQYQGGTQDFDVLGNDRVFGHTFTGLPTGIIAATMEIHLRALSGKPSNDGIGLELVGGTTPFAWYSRISQLPGAGGTWNQGQHAVFTLNLAALPNANGGFTDILPNINVDQALDVYVQDDTAVDYMILNVTTCGNCIPPPPGMVSWWPLDETNGAFAYDIVGGNHGTQINGPTPATGMVDGALSFDRVDDYVNLGNDSSLNIGTDDFSVDMWLYVNGTSDADVIRKPSSGWITSNSKGYRISTANGQIRVAVGNGGSWYVNYQSANLSTNKWHHFAWVLDRDNGSYIYIDGVLSSTYTATDTTTDISSSNNASIGGRQKFFNGIIDEVEIFNRSLTAAEIQAIYNAGSAGKCKNDTGPCKGGDQKFDVFLERLKKIGNADFSDVSFAEKLFGNEKINLMIGTEDKIYKIMIITRDAKVMEITKGSFEDPTLIAYVEMETAEKLLESQDINKFKEALGSEEIRIEGTGVINKVKAGLVKLLMRFL